MSKTIDIKKVDSNKKTIVLDDAEINIEDIIFPLLPLQKIAPPQLG